MLVALIASADAKSKPKTYQSGKLLDVSVEDVSRGTAVIGGMAAPIPGKLYVFKIELKDLIYFVENRLGNSATSQHGL